MNLLQSLNLSEEKPKKLIKYSEYLEGGKITQAIGFLEGNTKTCIAVDPGVNFGLTLIHKTNVYIFNGKLATTKSPMEYSYRAFMFTQEILKKFKWDIDSYIVEGAAFHKTFGQVGLAEVRNGYYLGMRLMQPEVIKVSIVPPMTCRKVVFDNGKTQAGDYFPFLNHNAADSLALGLYGILRPSMWTEDPDGSLGDSGDVPD